MTVPDFIELHTDRKQMLSSYLLVDNRLFVSLLIAASLALAWLLFGADAAAVAHAWRFDGPISHGFPTLAIAAVIVFSRARKNAGNNPSLIYYASLCALVFLYWLASFGDILALRLIALTFILPVAIGSIYGTEFSKLFLLFSLLLLGAMPVFNGVIPLLQLVTVNVTHPFLNFLQIPARIAGTSIQLPGGIITVEEGCSGVHFLMVSIVLGTLIWEQMFSSWKSYLPVLAVAVAQSLVTNWIRVTALIVIAHQTNFTSPLMREHLTFGWIIYCLTLLPLFLLLRKQHFATASDETYRYTRIESAHVGFALLVLITLSLPWLLQKNDILSTAGTPQNLHIEIPLKSTECVFFAAPNKSLNEEARLPLDLDMTQLIRCPDARISVSAALLSATSTATADNAQQMPPGWKQSFDYAVNTAVALTVGETISGTHELAGRAFFVDGTLTPNIRKAKLAQLGKLLRMQKVPIVAITFSSACDSDCRSEAQRLLDLTDF